MPYFRVSPSEGWLLVHVPKTGGTSVSTYWSHRFALPLTPETLFSTEVTTRLPTGHVFPCPRQHLPYSVLWRWASAWGIDRRGLRVVAVVRHPYTRLISDLFYFKRITRTSSPEDVWVQVKEHVHLNPEGHAFPQHWMIQRPADPSAPPVVVLHTETLTDDMHALGFADFALHLHAANDPPENYEALLSDEACAWIDRVYADDFRHLGYATRSQRRRPRGADDA
jgi:hypothetical protein